MIMEKVAEYMVEYGLRYAPCSLVDVDRSSEVENSRSKIIIAVEPVVYDSLHVLYIQPL